MPTLRGIAVEIAVSSALLPAYADPEPNQEPNTTSSYVEAVSNRWFAVFVRIPHDHEPKGDVSIIKVFLDGHMIAETWRYPGEQLPVAPLPEGVAGFDGDIVPAYEAGLAMGLRRFEEEQRVHDDAQQWLIQGYISGEVMRFPHVVTDNNEHEAGDAAEWEGKAIVVQVSRGSILKGSSEDALGNYVRGELKTVGDVLAFTFKHRPKKILQAVLSHTTQSCLSDPQHPGDPDSPDSDKTIRSRPAKGKRRTNSLDSNATVRRNAVAAAAATSDSNDRKPLWNPDLQQIDWITKHEYAQRMHNPTSANPADQQWMDNLAKFNNKWLYCCKRMKPNSKFVWCDNKDCEIGVFHFWCVGLTSEPHWGGRLWFCPICRDLPEEELRIRDGEEDDRNSDQME